MRYEVVVVWSYPLVLRRWGWGNVQVVSGRESDAVFREGTSEVEIKILVLGWARQTHFLRRTMCLGLYE